MMPIYMTAVYVSTYMCMHALVCETEGERECVCDACTGRECVCVGGGQREGKHLHLGQVPREFTPAK